MTGELPENSRVEQTQAMNSTQKPPIARKPITSEQRKLLAAPTIESQMPIKFQNGTTLTDWGGYCLVCEEPIQPDQLRGNITQVLPSVATIDAVGICPACNLLTPFHIRIRDTLAMEWQENNGQWLVQDSSGIRPLGSKPVTPKQKKSLSLLDIICLATITAVIVLAALNKGA
jgi:hypothetical protein